MVIVIHGGEGDLVVDPVGFSLVERLDYLVELLIPTLVVVLEKID